MKYLFSLMMLFFSFDSTSNVFVQTIYFNPNTLQLDSESKNILENLKSKTKRMHVQVIELNAYTNADIEPVMESKICNDRIEYLLTELSLADENLTIHKYGRNRIDLNFNPIHWDRVDIYYHEMPNNSANDDIIDRLNLDAFVRERIKNLKPIPQYIPASNETDYSEPDPLILNVVFYGGTANMYPDSKPCLFQLKDTLLNNQSLNAHIRGHVCCGNKKSLSRKRAKAVYKFLIENGIDSKRLSFKGYSNGEPLIYPEINDQDRRMNRRVDVIFQ